MAQYQSFPGVTGASYTFDKLTALRLPSLLGKRFLDVGCNEGFFCGYAKFNGATRAVGLDYSTRFIERARARFPDCEFFCKSWDQLPEGPFDVILLASALHYAENQPDFLKKLINQLAPDGTLVLELGVASQKSNKWVKVTRGIDERLFPTWPKLREVLQNYAWKHVGPSVSQQGDPVGRQVIHISLRRPIAYLLMQPPAYGKSSIAKYLFAPAGVKVVSNDHLFSQVALGKEKVPDSLAHEISTDFSVLKIDQAINRVFAAGLGPQLVSMWVQQAGPVDFVLDAYIPIEFHADIQQLIADQGYMPVELRWKRIGNPLPSSKASYDAAEAYYDFLAQQAGENAERLKQSKLPFRGTTGYVDELVLLDGTLTIRGWTMHESGTMPILLGIDLEGNRLLIDSYEKQTRPDVQKRFGLSSALCGYRFTIPLPNVSDLANLGVDVKVFGGNAEDTLDGPFHLAAKVVRQLQQSVS